MASVYVSYRSTEQAFVRDVVTRLKAFGHEVHIDYDLEAGVDWPSEQLQQLRECEVFLVFVSKDTRASDFQNSEMGSARTWSRLVDQKQIVQVLIDNAPPPRPLEHLDYLSLPDRNVEATAQEIESAIRSRKPRIRLFISHAHRDQELAAQLVSTIEANFEIPKGALRCTSVPNYQLDLGVMAADALRRELGSAACVIALLTPSSLENEWVLFELGAAWFNAKASIPLLAGGLEDKDLPGPLRGAAGGQLSTPLTIHRLLQQLGPTLGWSRKDDVGARSRTDQLVDYVKAWRPVADPVAAELKATFGAKRARIGSAQGQLLDRVTSRSKGKAHVHIEDLAKDSSHAGNELFYRLEQLRMLGFLSRVDLGESDGAPRFGWKLSDRYRKEIEA